MARTPEFRTLGKLVRRLRTADYEPVLVGGMALIVYGSSRATFDTHLLTDRKMRLTSRSSDRSCSAEVFDCPAPVS